MIWCKYHNSDCCWDTDLVRYLSYWWLCGDLSIVHFILFIIFFSASHHIMFVDKFYNEISWWCTSDGCWYWWCWLPGILLAINDPSAKIYNRFNLKESENGWWYGLPTWSCECRCTKMLVIYHWRSRSVDTVLTIFKYYKTCTNINLKIFDHVRTYRE